VLRDPSLMETLDRENLLQQSQTTASLEQHFALIASAYPAETRRDHLLRVQNTAMFLSGIRFILGLTSVENMGRELTDIADFILTSSTAPIRESLAERYPEFTRAYSGDLAILGYGKLGGYEFNVASDCDLVFVFTEPRQTDEITSAEYFQRWIARYTDYLEAKSRLGFLYHCDSRLRPFGKNAPLAVGWDTFTDYYRSQAQLWEKMALTRARWICGNPQIRSQLDALKETVLFSAPPGREAVESILAMRKKIEQEKREEILKAGPGGLIDVEFIAQTLALYYGHSHPAIRKTSTLEILRAASGKGLLPFADAKQLVASYLFLREVENRLRIVNNVSLDAIPTEREELEKLTRRYALKLEAEKPTPDSFLELIARHTREVRQIFLRFFETMH